MADSARIEELRRRIQKDPASIAFAQLAEEYRRAGRLHEAVETCETGLARHPGYLSARVTLGRALLELGELSTAQNELKQVLRAAPENLAALRGLADIHHRRGELREALAHYRAALEFAPHDSELERIVAEISGQLEPTTRTPSVRNGLSFEDVQREFLSFSGEVSEPERNVPELLPTTPADTKSPEIALRSEPATVPDPESARMDLEPAGEPGVPLAFEAVVPLPEPAAEMPFHEPAAEIAPALAAAPVSSLASTQVLEQWLEAIVADRERRAALPEDPDGH